MTPQQMKVQIAREKWERELFLKIAAECEELAAKAPERYLARVNWILALGYGFLALLALASALIVAGVLVGMFAGHAGYLGMRLLVFAIPVVWTVGKCLFSPIKPPKGYVATRENHPELWAYVDELSNRVQCPQATSIVIDMKVNAAAAQRRKFGLVGPLEQHLVIGLPLMILLSKEELAGIIAHEFGHFAGKHGVQGIRAYRVQNSLDALESNRNSRWGYQFIQNFTRWYAPRFRATTLVLDRKFEFEADKVAADAVGADSYGNTLCKLPILGPHFYDLFWVTVHRQMMESPSPTENPFQALREGNRVPHNLTEVQNRLRARLNEELEPGDSHPTMVQRLQSIGFPIEGVVDCAESLTTYPSLSAAHTLLENHFSKVISELESDYRTESKDVWEAQFKRYVESKRRLAELESIPIEERDVDEQISLLENQLYLGIEQDIKPQLRAVLEAHPESVYANRILGRILADELDPAAIPFMERAVELNDRALDDLNSRLAAMYKAIGRYDQASKLEENEGRLQAFRQAVSSELRTFPVDVEIVPGEMSLRDRARFVERLRSMPDVAEAYLLDRKLKINGKSYLTVAIVPARGVFATSPTDPKILSDVRETVKFGRHITLVYVSLSNPILPRLRAMEGAALYVAGKH